MATLRVRASFADEQFPRGTRVELSPETAPHPSPFGRELCAAHGARLVRIGDSPRDRYAHLDDLHLLPEEEEEWARPRNHPVPEDPV